MRHNEDLVRIDAGQNAADVLASLDVRNLLQNDLPIFASVRPRSWQAGGHDSRAVVADFEACGFAVSFVHENRTLAAYTNARLECAVRSTTSWCDHFDLMLTRGRYHDVLLAG